MSDAEEKAVEEIDESSEEKLLVMYPNFFKQQPLKFFLAAVIVPIISIILAFTLPGLPFLEKAKGIVVFASLIPIPIALIWMLYVWVLSRGTCLTVTNKRTILRRGLLSRNTNEVLHSHVRNVQIDQSFFERLLKVGTVNISSAGQSEVEIKVRGMSNPYQVSETIDKFRDF